MDISSPTLTTNTDITPVFGDNVQDLLGTATLRVSPSAIITVNSIADTVDDLNSGTTTLRDAINQANGDTGEDLVVFDRSLFSTAQTITLSQGELDLTHNLDIIAPRDPLTGGDLVTVSGNNSSRVFEIGSGATVTLSGLIIADGSVTGDDGGGIKNSGTLTLDSSIVSNNSANISARAGSVGIVGSVASTVGAASPDSGVVFNGNGGGIYNSANLTVTNSTISGNKASLNGGGIFDTGTSTINNSTISGNSDSGISNNGTLKVNNSTINNNNSSFGIGGGIYNVGTVEVSNSNLSNNTSMDGGGIYNNSGGTVEVSNSTISGNLASGIYGYGGGGISSDGKKLTVSNSTISGNMAMTSGGGISNGGTLFVSNSTISGNSTFDNGGGIFSDGTVTLLFSTLTLNQASKGGGVYKDGFVASARNTIIAANQTTEDGINPDVSGSFTSNGYNLIGDSTGSTGFDQALGDIVGTSDNPIDPRLAPLDFNGGPTQTIALLPNSPAIDAADPTVLDTDPTTDQRGLDRVSNGRADIGAFEVQV